MWQITIPWLTPFPPKPTNDTKQEAEMNSQREKRMEEEKINGKFLGKQKSGQ